MNSASALELKSSAFKDGEFIPVRYTCKGEDVSPPLEWSGAPAETKSFALIMDDPDAPFGTWDHWVMYDISKDAVSLTESIPQKDVLPDGSKQGVNGFRRIGYGGPCPPPGSPHRYIFALYALDAALDLKPGLNKKSVLKAMEGHVLGSSKLTGLFRR